MVAFLVLAFLFNLYEPVKGFVIEDHIKQGGAGYVLWYFAHEGGVQKRQNWRKEDKIGERKTMAEKERQNWRMEDIVGQSWRKAVRRVE